METENHGEPANTGLPDTTTQQHPFDGPLSRTTRVSRYRKGKTNLDFTEARDSEWQWHQLGHMQVCTSLQTDNHASTPPLSFLQAGCPSCRPTSSVKALKAMVYPKMDVKTVVDLFHGDLAGKCREWHSRLAQPLVAAGMPELRVEECEYAWVGGVLQPLWICMSRWSRWVAWPRQWLQECRSWGLKNVRHEDRHELTAATVGFTSYHNQSIKPGKPGILRDFSESGNLRELSGKNCNDQSGFSLSFKCLCKTAVDWANRNVNKVSWISDVVRAQWWPVILLELMWNDTWWRSLLHLLFVAVTCGKTKKNKFKPLEKPGKLREFFFSHCAATLPIYLLLKIKVLSLV